MGLVVSETAFDLMLGAAKNVEGFVRETLAIEGGDVTAAKLEEFIGSLEMEKGKIEVFKRELPLSMHLLGKVIEWLTEELEQCRRGRCPAARHVFEEFMPIKSKFDDERGMKLETDYREKMKWMSSTQLWSDNHVNYDCTSNGTRNNTSEETGGETNCGHRRREDDSMPETRSRITSGASAPFKSPPAISVSPKEEKVAAPLPELSLSMGMNNSRPDVPVADEEHRGDGLSSMGVGTGTMTSSSATAAHLNIQCQQQQPQRKARRCWSQELHRRFVVALRQLGGAQVATPKQIRELMKINGLTNDEVKSHLQKYRLHTQRTPSTASAGNWPAVTVGGSSWVPQEQYTCSQQSISQSGSPQGPLQLANSSRAVSVAAADSCEEEDGRSESYSWK